MDSLLYSFRGLFVGSDDEELEGSGEASFESKWSWFIILEGVSKTLSIPVKKVTALGAIEFLNWWAYNKEKADDKEEKLRKMNNK